ncbi:[F-actin]-monooxygenase Mical [Frankliniella fusca]|uniref:F-actin monooxygenase n=1 Tax=Frankliniella fusca TaxID=407009 RepID=A0AAE1HTG7_9NEOP|nr:[F-actin]-monooxygenase Mical [Frankliniella fusca]
MEPRKQPVSPEVALASEVFDKLCSSTTLKTILGHHRHLCELLHLKPGPFPQFYLKLKSKLRSWKAQPLWNKFDKRASHKCYNRGKACPNTRVLIIGAGPCGLRAAIEAQLLGCKVVVIEKRDRISRNNVLHLWPFVIQDLRALGAKKFFGKFCAGSIDHISIRQLQCILLKVALILGVEFHEGVGFESLVPPPEDQTERIGWRCITSPADHPVSQYEFDVLVGADGKRNTLEGFKRKEFRGKLAIAITANFINRRSEAEARVEEISGVAFIFNQKFFKDLYAATGIDLENIVYYKDETHYFVMTAKKHSLLNKNVILQDYPDTAKLLDPENVDKEALMEYAREAADFSTNYKLPHTEFAVNHYGQPDVAMFDFTSMYAAENASRVVERRGHKLLTLLVGDSLLEPFWPTGSGCARGFLSVLDACWAIRAWGSGQYSSLEVLAERESIYRLLGQTTPENLNRDLNAYTLEPQTRYPNLNFRAVTPIQVRGLYDTDDISGLEAMLLNPGPTNALEMPKKRRRKDSQVHPDTLLHWLKKQVALYDSIRITDMTLSFKNGLALCAILHRYRPDLIDFHSLKPDDIVTNNQLAFDTLERELGIPPVMTAQEMEECEVPDKLTMLSYLSQIYDTFRGEIPHIKHPKLDEMEDKKDKTPEALLASRKRDLSKLTPQQTVSLLSRITNHRQSAGRKKYGSERIDREGAPSSIISNPERDRRHSNDVPRRNRKRRSGASDRSALTLEEQVARRCPRDWEGLSLEEQMSRIQERIKRLEEIKQNRLERQKRSKYMQMLTRQQFYKSIQMLQANAPRSDSEDAPFEDYSLFMYRMTAPDFQDRVKDLEQKLLYPDRDSRLQEEMKRGTVDPEFSGRIKHIEDKLRRVPATEKKPKDLNRAIGKIEKTDWNVKEIEKKIAESKTSGRSPRQRAEKQPKLAKYHLQFSAMEKKLRVKGFDEETASKYAEIDISLKQLEKKIKEGGALEAGKVSAMAAQLAYKNQQEAEKVTIQRSNSRPALVLPAQGGSEMCHFCNKRVYLMERLSAEGRFFHRGCFRCEYCSTTLRLGSYAFDRDGKFGSRFFCTHHFGMHGTQKMKTARKSEELRNILGKENIPRQLTIVKTPDKNKYAVGGIDAADSQDQKVLSTPQPKPLDIDIDLDRGQTPERITFSNLAGVAGSSDQEDHPSEMDEDEWTDRNFGASAAECDSSDDLSDLSDEDDDAAEAFAEAIDVPLTADETLRLAENWTRRYSTDGTCQNGVNDKDRVALGSAGDEDEEPESGSYEYEDGSDDFSYQEYDSEDEDSDTATEGEEEIRQRELRKQEVRLEVPDCLPGRNDTDTGSDTEVKTTPISPHCSSPDLFCSLSDLTTLDSDVPVIKANHESSGPLSDQESNLNPNSNLNIVSSDPATCAAAEIPTHSHLNGEGFNELSPLNISRNAGNGSVECALLMTDVKPSLSSGPDLVPLAFDALFNDLCGDFDSDQISVTNYSVDSDSVHGHGWSDTESVINMNCAAVLQPLAKPSEATANLKSTSISHAVISSPLRESEKKGSQIKVQAKIVDAQSLMPSKSTPLILHRAVDRKSKPDPNSISSNSSNADSNNFIPSLNSVKVETCKLSQSIPILSVLHSKSSASAPLSPQLKDAPSSPLTVAASPKAGQKKSKIKDIMSSVSVGKDSVPVTPSTPSRRRKQRANIKENLVSTPSPQTTPKIEKKPVSYQKGSVDEAETAKSSNGHDSGHSTASATPSSPPATPSSLPTTPTILSRPSSPMAPQSPPPSPVLCHIISLPNTESLPLSPVRTVTDSVNAFSRSEAETSKDAISSKVTVEPVQSDSRPFSPSPASRPISPPTSRPLSPVAYRRRSSGALSSSSRRNSLVASRYNPPTTSSSLSYSTSRYSTPNTSYNYTSRYSSSSPSSYASPPSSKPYVSPSYSSSTYSSPMYSSTSYSSQPYSSKPYTSGSSLGASFTSKYTPTPTSSYYSSPSNRSAAATRSSKSKESCVVASEDTSSESESVENSATEIETDSEFEHDGTTPTRHEIPDIIISDHLTQDMEEPKKVQIRSGNVINGNVIKESSGIKLQFSPLQNKIESNNNAISNNPINQPTPVRPSPLMNPRRGDYLLNRTQSTGGIASKLSLELKKRYLLGADGAGSVKKSGSATTLDTKFKSFVDQISEHQKLLNPAPEPSPTMQAFLQSSSKLHTSPKPSLPSSTTSSITASTVATYGKKELPPVPGVFPHVCGQSSLEKQSPIKLEKSIPDVAAVSLGGHKELPAENMFEHVCGKTAESLRVANCRTSIQKNEPDEPLDSLQPDSLVNQPSDNEESRENPDRLMDSRPRSPAHETSIIVPSIMWQDVNKGEKEDMDSDSLSSEVSLPDEENEPEDCKEEESEPECQHLPPRVEVHSSSGEVLRGDILQRSTSRPPLDLPLSSAMGLTLGRQTGSGRSSPVSPVSIQADIGQAPLTETELSDWAHDANPGVSEDLEDVEFNINPEFVTLRRNKKSKGSRKLMRSENAPPAKIAMGEDLEDFENEESSSPAPVPVVPRLHALASEENLEFMDTAEEGSSTDDQIKNANQKLRNQGYAQFVNLEDTSPCAINKELLRLPGGYMPLNEDADDDDASTPIVDTGLPIPPVVGTSSTENTSSTSSSSDSKSILDQNKGSSSTVELVDDENSCHVEPITDDTTTTSDLVTIVDMPLQPPPAAIKSSDEVEQKAYAECVKRLQGRVSPFSNARDSIDIRKSRRSNKSSPELISPVEEIPATDLQSSVTLQEEPETPVSSKNGCISLKSPTTSRKLEQLSQERSKQKSLIHEMVMDKLLAQKKSPQERRARKGIRSSASPLSSSNSISCLPNLSSVESESMMNAPSPPESIVPHKSSNIKSEDMSRHHSDNDILDENKTDEKENFYTPMLTVKKRTLSTPDDREEYLTPLTSMKKRAMSETRARPFSVHGVDHMREVADKARDTATLPDTPLTNPEAFSLPDIRKALFNSPDEVFKTPIAPPRSKHEESKRIAERERARREARARARLKSDEELGLSPEDYIKSLKEKASRRLDSSADRSSSKNKPESSYNSPTSSQLKIGGGDGVTLRPRPKSKDSERRRSIIQAVSDFFHKKTSSSGSPSSPSPPSTSHNTPEKERDRDNLKFPRFRLAQKSKDKEKVKQQAQNVRISEKEPLNNGSMGFTKAAAVSSAATAMAAVVGPPPVPPPPSTYMAQTSAQTSGTKWHVDACVDDSQSELEDLDDSRATGMSTPTQGSLSIDGSISKKQTRLSKRVSRQAQMKRLRMAQEIQRQLEELEVKQKVLEQQGVCVEKSLRGEGNESGREEVDLLHEWFNLMRERSELRRYERELIVRAQELELEDRHARLQLELRDRLSKDDASKTGDDVATEGRILSEMLEIVERRDSLIARLEADRQRYQEEDKDLEAQMLAKGLRLTPLRKESHV